MIFRGKKIGSGEWVSGYGLYYERNGISKISTTEPPCSGESEPHFDWEDVDTNTVSRYTGFLDINKKLIYEGDIIKFTIPDTGENSGLCAIGGYFTFTGYVLEEYGELIVSSEIRERPDIRKRVKIVIDYFIRLYDLMEKVNCDFGAIKVIGNIYDSPELLQPSIFDEDDSKLIGEDDE